MADSVHRERKEGYCAQIAEHIRRYAAPDSLLEAGVGEATTLSGVCRRVMPERAYGFDISWSRIAAARRWIEDESVSSVTLTTGSLLHVPLLDDSVDVVFTSHAIEPNRGREQRIIEELYRVARHFLFLFEPSYELAGSEARERMDHHGYCRGILATCERLGFRVIEHRLLDQPINPLNPTAVMVIAKGSRRPTIRDSLACPVSRSPLIATPDALICPASDRAYPVIGGIPCLRPEHGIFVFGHPALGR
jgi:SAM-dependent methyltransferase